MSGCSPCCTTARRLLVRATGILNDPSNTQWPQPELLDYLNEALTLIQHHRPDAFTDEVVLDLKPGAYQKLPDGMDRLVTVLGNVDPSSSDSTPIVSSPVKQADEEYGRRLSGDTACIGGVAAGDSCGQSAQAVSSTTVSSFSPNAFDARSYTVSPAVPIGGSAKVLARVVREPCDIIDLDSCAGVPRKYDSAIVDWILHRAYLKETESEFAGRSSTNALNRFFMHIGKGIGNEFQFGSGYWNGVEGDGDAQARQRSRQ